LEVELMHSRRRAAIVRMTRRAVVLLLGCLLAGCAAGADHDRFYSVWFVNDGPNDRWVRVVDTGYSFESDYLLPAGSQGLLFFVPDTGKTMARLSVLDDACEETASAAFTDPDSGVVLSASGTMSFQIGLPSTTEFPDPDKPYHSQLEEFSCEPAQR
jgi:hypothetical protein